MKISHLVACCAAIALCGCESMPFGNKDKDALVAAQDKDAPISISDDDKALGALVDAKLPDESCGMILWTLDAQRPVPVFKYVAGEKGMVQIGGREIELTRMGYEGATGYGVFEQQQFTSENGVSVEVSSRFGLGFDGGAYLERGLIKVEDQSGWSIVAPAAGIAGCRR